MRLIDRALGGLDPLYFVLLGRPRGSPPLFWRGWGSEEAIQAVIARFAERGRPAIVLPTWEGEWRGSGAFAVRDACFPTPLYRQYLPPEARRARLRLFMPHRHSGCSVVMVPTRFEEGFRARESMAARLAGRGIASVLLESPFMGSRRPAYQPTTMLATLSDFVLMGAVAIEEARAVLQWLRERWSQKVCLTGISLGGYLAAVAAALAPHPVSLVTVLAPHDGNVVYLDGLSRDLCDWREMQKTCGGATPVAERFRAVFDAISLSRLPLPATVGPVIALAATHDRYVPPHSFRTMAQFWQRAELRWIGGGHVSTILRPGKQLGAIMDAVGRDAADYGLDASAFSQATKSATSGLPAPERDVTTK